MNDVEVERVKSSVDEYSPEQRDIALRSVKLQFKALIFLQRKLCRGCRFKVLSRVRQGQKFEPSLLCERCRKIYEDEVK